MNPGPPPPADEDRRAAYQRGKLLTILVVVVTTALFLWSSASDLWQVLPADKAPVHGTNKWVDFGLNCVLIGALCRCAWRGGKTSTGCLTIFYSLSLAVVGTGVGVAVVLAAAEVFHLAGGGLARWNLLEAGGALQQIVVPVAMAGWAIFAFWVLVLSKDARCYRGARQQGIHTAADAFNEWHLRHH